MNPKFDLHVREALVYWIHIIHIIIRISLTLQEVKVTFSETSLEKTDSDVDKVENFQEEVEIEENHVDNVKKEINSDSDVD